MGYFGHWLIVRGAEPAALEQLGLEPAPQEAAPGWRYAFGRAIPTDLDDLLHRAASAGDGPAIGVWINDSDYAQLVAIGNDSRSALAFGPPSVNQGSN